jgi:outer membrane protein W
MRHILRTAAALLIGMTLLPTLATAQFQVNVMGSRTISLESGSSGGLWGGGATLRYFTSPHIAIGLNGRYFGDKESLTGGGFSSTTRGSVVIVTGQAEYFLTQSKEGLQPYAGLEAGLYASKVTFDITGPGILGTTTVSGSTNNFGLVPKVGLQYAITPTIGVNAEAGYQLVFGDGSVGKSLLLNLGAFYKFGRRE